MENPKFFLKIIALAYSIQKGTLTGAARQGSTRAVVNLARILSDFERQNRLSFVLNFKTSPSSPN
jgi:hypothetical protein